ncbi:hypothetical protein LTR53_018108, partial [Teratosphaeriaceae sp. CCFEE 6253]
MASLTGLAQLVSVPGLLAGKHVDQAVGAVTDVILREHVQGHGDIRAQAIKALTAMAHSVPQSVRDRSVPAFMVDLPDVTEGETVPSTVLEAFAQLATERQIFDTVVLRLKNKLRAARHQGASTGYQRALVFAMLYAFTFGNPMQEDGLIRSAYYADYAEPLIADFVKDASSQPDSVMVDAIGRIANIILRAQGVHYQSGVYHRGLEWLARGDDSTDAAGSQRPDVSPFLLYYYAALRPEVVEATDIIGRLQQQSNAAVSESDGKASTSATSLRLISLLVNKFANPKTMKATLVETGLEVDALVHDTASPQALCVAFAVVKGLLIQGKSGALTTRYLQTLLDLLPTSTDTSARQFATLLAPDDILTKANHCLISGLYKQKVFNQCIPFLTTTLRTADPAQKPRYLVALSGLLRWLPYSVLEPSLADLTP